jgi:hypothetical protein
MQSVWALERVLHIASYHCAVKATLHTLSWLPSVAQEWHMSLAALCMPQEYEQEKLHGLSPRANFTDRATAACRRSDCQLLWIKGATWSAWRILRPYSRFSREQPLLFYQVAPQLYSRGWVDPVPDPLLFFLVVPGIEPWPLDHRGGHINKKEARNAGKRNRTKIRTEIFIFCSVNLGLIT